MRKPIAAPAALLAPIAAAAMLVLAGCGESEPETPDQPPAQLLKEALANLPESGEAAIGLEVGLEGQPLLTDPVTAELQGPFAVAADGGIPSFDLSLDGEAAGFGVDAELVSTGDDAFVVFFGENYRVGAERVAAAEQQLLAATGGASGFGLDLASWFQSPRYGGEEEVTGTDTELIEADLNTAAIAEDLGALGNALGVPQAGAIAAGAGPGKAEAWVAFDDDTIRRLHIAFPFTVPPEQQSAVAGATGGSFDLEVELTDLGSEVAIEPPPGGGFQPIEELIGQLRDLASLGGI